MNLIPLPENLLRSQARDPSINAVFMDEGRELIIERSDISKHCWYCRLIVKRIDGEPIRSWRVLQDVKNAVVGSDSVAIEVYPAEQEVIDTGNIYHLWVLRKGNSLSVGLVLPKSE